MTSTTDATQGMSKKLQKRHVKGVYGQWRLVELATGKWSALWCAFLDPDLEDAFLAILEEDQSWFDSQNTYARPESCATNREALEKIILGIEGQMRNSPSKEEYFRQELKKARLALLRARP